MPLLECDPRQYRRRPHDDRQVNAFASGSATPAQAIEDSKLTDEPDQPDKPAAYSAQEFHAAVLACRPRTAVFDCDGTLWSPDSGFGFMGWTLENGLVSPERRHSMEQRYQLYEQGSLHTSSEIAETIICGEMVQLYSGLSEGALREAASAFVAAHVVPHIFPAMAALVASLRAIGTELWAVSSTNHWVVEAGVRGFSIPAERVLAARVAVDSKGEITGRLLSVPTDQAKADALQQAGLPHPDTVFGNSIHDAAMLALAAHAFPVNPNAALAHLAREQGWRIFSPAPALASRST